MSAADPYVVLGASTQEEDELARAVDDLVGSACTLEDAHRAADGVPPGRPAWHRLGDELALVGLHLPESLGGQGQTFAVHAAVVAALGRRLAPVPYLPVLGSALTLLAGGTSPAQRDRWLPAVLAGESIVVVAGLDAGWTSSAGEPDVVVSDGPGGPRLSGTTSPVVQGADADLLLVVADGRVLAVDPADAEVGVEPLETLDLTRPRARFRLDDVAAEALGSVDAALLRRALLEATTLVAVDGVAAARACLVATIHYATIRTQFDRPIGSFQAVQHALADLFGEVASAEAAVDLAVRALSGTPDAPSSVVEAVRVARVASAEALSRAARDGVHLHGGIGFTWEHDAHLFLRRAMTDRSLLGDPTLHRRELARALVAAS